MKTRLVLNTQTHEVLTVPQEEAELICDPIKFKQFANKLMYRQNYQKYTTDPARFIYTCSFGDVVVDDVLRGYYKMYPDTVASRILYGQK